MNVLVRICKRRAKCLYCGKMIEAGDYQVVCSYYTRKEHGWLKKMLFHAGNPKNYDLSPNCWLDRAIAELDSRPHVETRGRKANPIDDTSKAIRLKILRRRASIMQRLEYEMTTRARTDKILKLTGLLEKCTEEIKDYGGVPKKWL